MRFVMIAMGLLVLGSAIGAADVPMKFNDVKEVAPGVFFRYSSISATDKNVVFGGSNNIWVVFADYVVVIDANFPKEAADVVAAIRKTTNKPIRYVFDTHHHGDHAYGNAVFVKEGAKVLAQANCAQLLKVDGPKQFAEAGKGPTGRKDIAESTLVVPNETYQDKLVLDDGKGQRVEFLFFGHAHTPGDGAAYLPKHKLLCTGDACVNGAFNFMGHGDSASWIKALEGMHKLDINLVLPGHGLPSSKDLLDKQKRYFVELREQVKKGLEAKKELADIQKAIDMPWYKEWTGVTPSPANVEHVYKELTGLAAPPGLLEEFGAAAGAAPKNLAGWTRPKRIVVPAGLMPARLAELKTVAPEVEFVPVRSAEQAAREARHADAVLGFCTPEIVQAGPQLRWLQMDAVADLFPELLQSGAVLTRRPSIPAERQWQLYRENVRRFAAGEPLLAVVDKSAAK